MNLSRLFCLYTLLFSTTLFADELSTLADAREVTDKAVALFQNEMIVEGYNVLKPYWPLQTIEIDSLANQTGTQWPMIKQRFGTSIATEFVKEMHAGKSLARFVYMQKFQNHAIRWVFTFYRPRDKWIVNGVSFDDRLELLF